MKNSTRGRKPWSVAQRCSLPFLSLTLLLTSPAFAEDSENGQVDILGTWYVLIHYTDDNSSHPERMRWEDRVWVFEKSGNRIKWQQFPIVVFDDEYGRFERRPTGQYARVLGAWEPSESQLADIRDGLQVNDRGSKAKTLRGSDEAGWKTGSRARPGSASVVTYTENWTVEGLPDRPVFERRDSMGGGRTDSLEGITRFSTEKVLPSGNRLRGSYERDDSRRGTFRMMRSGPVGDLKKAAKSQSELQQRTAVREIGMAKEELSHALASALARRGVSLSDSELNDLVDEALVMIVAGSSDEDVVRAQADSAEKKFYAFAPEGAEHDVAFRYALPFDPKHSRRLAAGVGAAEGDSTHSEERRYAFDFEMPSGARVLAARSGVVKRIGSGFAEKGSHEERATPPTRVVYVLHDDGTYAIYGHLEPELAVQLSDRIDAGQPLGEARSPHLHFGVARRTKWGKRESVDIRFDDSSPGGFLPEEGNSYGGAGGD